MKDILLLALSTLRIDKNSHEVAQSNLIYEGKNIGVYHYQLEPILHLYKYRNEEPESIIYLYTDKTDEKNEFMIDEVSYSCSARDYFEQKVREMFGDVEVLPIKVTDDVSTIKDVIKTLRKKYRGNPKDMQLTMDIHGAFRNTQMILQSIITLLRFEDIIPKDIYTVQYTDSTGTIEKVDEINDVNEFVSAMNEFLTYGRSKTLESYVNKTNQNTELAVLIKDISDSIQLCNVGLFDESVKRMAEYVENYPKEGMGNYNDIFIDSIKASYGELMDKKKRSMVANKVKWCVDHDFIQQALTLIESDALEDLYNRNIIKFHYDYPEEKSMNLYVGRIDKSSGTYPLKTALDLGKKSWESRINYSMVPWIRKNLMKKSENENFYINPMAIKGTNTNRYYEWPINRFQSAFSKPKRIKFYSKNSRQWLYIDLNFDINRRLSEEGRYNLARLLMLHLALKECRNESNHASSKERATIEEVKQAIYAYVELTKTVIEECSNQGQI